MEFIELIRKIAEVTRDLETLKLLNDANTVTTVFSMSEEMLFILTVHVKGHMPGMIFMRLYQELNYKNIDIKYDVEQVDVIKFTFTEKL